MLAAVFQQQRLPLACYGSLSVLTVFSMLLLVSSQGWVGEVFIAGGAGITSFNGVMVAPRYPNAVGSYYLFPFIENQPVNGIIQPVITGGYAEGGFKMNTGLCCDWSYPWTDLVTVYPGDQITFTNQLDRSSNTWYLSLSAPGRQSTSTSFPNPWTPVGTVYWAGVAVELYNSVTWDFGPMVYQTLAMQTVSTDTSVCSQTLSPGGILQFHIGSQSAVMNSVGALCTWNNFVIWNQGAATLDFLTSLPAAAYSVRKLTQSYKGKAIQVRRSRDGATADIGFTSSGQLDTTTLLQFIGSSNGSVSIWYDQSGNGNNAVQTSASQQPLIVSAGALITSGTSGSPSLLFNAASSQHLHLNSYPFQSSSSAAAYVVNSVRTSRGWQRFFDFGSDPTHNLFATPTSPNSFRITTAGASAEQGVAGQLMTSTNSINLAEFHHAGAGAAMSASSTSGSSLSSGSQAISVLPSALNGVQNNYIGRSQYSADPYFDGWMSEIIFVGTDPQITSSQPQVNAFVHSIRNYYSF